MMKIRNSTLCYIEKDNQYLMLHRVVKKNDVNTDKWIGVGGHFEYGESPEDCVLREVKEETGYTLTSYQYRGLVTFVFADVEMEYMSLFTANGFEGIILRMPLCRVISSCIFILNYSKKLISVRP